jgi:hypothetical protein
MSGEWIYNCNDLTLWLTVQPHYEVDLERCNTSAQVLDWIAQVAGKIWATDKIVGALVRKLDEVLYLQKNFCPGGITGSGRKTVNVRKLLKPDPLKKGLALKGER